MGRIFDCILGLLQIENCSSPQNKQRAIDKKKEPDTGSKTKNDSKKEDDKKRMVKILEKRWNIQLNGVGRSTPFFPLRGKDLAQNARFQVGYKAF